MMIGKNWSVTVWFRTVNVARSMLSSTLGRTCGVDIGKRPLVLKLMKGAYNRKHSVPKYAIFWDVGTVVDFFITLGRQLG
jgi:hypothetical protein